MSQSTTASRRDGNNSRKSGASKGNGRLPKAPSPLLGPLKHFSGNYQFHRAQEYYDEGGEYVDEISNNYPEWKAREEYARLVQDGREVLEYMEDMLDKDSWSATKLREVKHASREFRTSALRSSRKAKQERLEEGVAYVPGTSSTAAQQAPLPQASLRPPEPGPSSQGSWFPPDPPNLTPLSAGTVYIPPIHAGGRAGTF